MSADGTCLVTLDDAAVRICDGPMLLAADSVVDVAVIDSAVWIVSASVASKEHWLHRFTLAGDPVSLPTSLGWLGDHCSVTAHRTGARVALVEGDRSVLVRERDGAVTVESLGERRCDRRILVGARGVAERIGASIRLRGGTVPPLAIPVDVQSYALGAASAIFDGTSLLVELVARDRSVALVYDLRSGALAKRIRLGQLRILAIAEQAGVVVLGRSTNIALLDVASGRCTMEHLVARPLATCVIDTLGRRLVAVEPDGTLSSLVDSQPEPEPEPEPERPASTDTPVDVVVVAEPPPEPTLAAICPPASQPLVALGPPARAHRPFSDAVLALYLDAARAWIEALCATTLAIASGDAAALELARARERDTSQAIATWNIDGAPHVELARDLGLSSLASNILWLVAAPQIWGELARAYARCTGDPARPLVDELLLAHLLEASVTQRSAIARELDVDSPLVRSGAISVGPGIRPYAMVSAHAAIARRLAGDLVEHSREVVPLDDVMAPRAAIAELVGELQVAHEQPARIIIRGLRHAGRRTLAASLAREIGRSVIVVPVGELTSLRSRLCAVSLRGQLPCIDLDDVSDEPAVRAQLRAILDDHATALFVRAPVSGELPVSAGHHTLELPRLTETERRTAWESRGVDAAVATELASRFSVGAGVIARVARTGGDANRLVATLRSFRSARIAAVAERVETLASWRDLVVPTDIEDALRELVSRVKHRRMVLETWGLSRVAATARGVTSLFQGGPGTGKTMAAGVIAAALGYELWRVDLSKVVSKWVGETEKNLAAVFDAAEEGEIVLLFDEADSLFAKRTEVKSGNDKHGNVATNYLLQRLDSFTGVAILTTNFGSAIDGAFKRRMSVHVQFPFPDEDDRERLWRALVPASLPTRGELGFASLARAYELSGGYIRNAVLRAAYLAADGDGALTADHLIRAVALEKERAGKLGNGRLD